MKLFHWLVTAPAAVILVVFAVANRDPVTLTFWPLPVTLAAPIYLVVLLALLAGFLIGELVAWINGRRWRRQARRSENRIEELERELVARGVGPDLRSQTTAEAKAPTRAISRN